jgi:predicted RNase H-like nuclease (RuvC/YqgF family)
VATQEMDEEQEKPREKDSHVKEMQQQLKKAQHIIAQFYQENRELKRKLKEKTLEEKTPQSKVRSYGRNVKGKEYQAKSQGYSCIQIHITFDKVLNQEE